MPDSPDPDDNPPWATDDEQTAPTAAELEAAGQNSMFGDPPPAPAPASTQPYRVLARKYRPQTFAELIGQEPMVRTLSNAIAQGRLAHAFLMTGVRGVGKTSTARLIAKALNCIGPDGQGGPTINSCGVCEPCRAIAEGRHIDVIEMDAASNTGVDDVREIIEAVRYAAVSARYKIYIIDEVHMLSRNAFNALLKTLEEPPAHVKFLFATTEVEKLPVTVLSRTQRFDLRRISADMLQAHFAKICAAEGVEAEADALAMIAAAAEGSVRDGLSILDQAIAHADLAGGGAISGEKVRDMLGLADKTAQLRLLGHLLDGDPQAMLAAVDQQYALGVEPLAIMRALLELTHRIALAQVGETQDELAQRLKPAQVHRLWQLLLKGHDEVRTAPDPLIAAQMALLRVLHAADMPDPGKLVKRLEEIAAIGGGAAISASPTGAAPQAALDWALLVEDAEQAGAFIGAGLMRDWVRVIALERGKLVYALAPGLSHDPANDIRDALLRATGEKWTLETGEGEAAPTIREIAEAAKEAEAARIRAHPLVAAAFAAFPDAEFVTEAAPPRGREGWNRRA